MITSRQHPLVRAFRNAARGDGVHALLDGWHLLHDAVEQGLDVTHVAITGTPSPEHAPLLDRLPGAADISEVSASVMDALSPVRAPTGVAALMTRPQIDGARLFSPAPPLVVVAIDVQDPGNAGAIIRSAEAGGATGVILAGASADPWGWKAIRATMGSIFRTPVLRIDEPIAACEMVREHGLRVMAAVPRGGRAMYDTRLDEAVALLFGSEGQGLSENVLRLADVRVSVPMHGPVESLNVAMAATVLTYEAFRQRRARRGQ